MAIELADAVTRLAHNRKVIHGLASAVSPAQAGWRPAPEDWSVLEVVNHLADEEAEDFRTRLDYTLHRPQDAWPPIDPQGWVESRDYAARELGESLARFESEREASLAWLRDLREPDWSRENVHPVFGSMSAGSLLHAWLAHDLLHIRQLTELQYAWLCRQAQPFDPGYAGEW